MRIYFYNPHIQQIINCISFYLSKNSVFLVQVTCFIQSYEKLASIGYGSTVCHPYNPSSREPKT